LIASPNWLRRPGVPVREKGLWPVCRRERKGPRNVRRLGTPRSECHQALLANRDTRPHHSLPAPVFVGPAGRSSGAAAWAQNGMINRPTRCHAKRKLTWTGGPRYSGGPGDTQTSGLQTTRRSEALPVRAATQATGPQEERGPPGPRNQPGEATSQRTPMCSIYRSRPSTRMAFSRRNLGQTWSRNGTSGISRKMRSSDSPIGK